MASLTISAYWARKFIRIGGIVLIVVLVFQWTISTAISAWKAAHPAEDVADNRFGQIPKIVFADKTFTKKSFTFELAEDNLPKFAKVLPVFAVQRSSNPLLALEKDAQMARQVGFVGDPLELENGVYKFTNETAGLSLTARVLGGSFKLSYPYQNDQLLMSAGALPSKEQAISIANSFLSRAGREYEDLKSGKQTVSYYKIGFDTLEPLTAPAEANLIRVDFFRKPITYGGKDYPILPSEPKQASVSALVSSSDVEAKKIVDLSFKYVPIDREIFGKYKVKTTLEAKAALEAGNYWPAVDATGNTVTIRKVEIAYFEPNIASQYMQPIYVFSGDNNFVGYLPALAE